MESKLFSELKARGFLEQLSDEGLESLLNGQKLNFYIGFDPTADSLHIGHLMGIVAMTHLARAGHQPFVLVGGATGRIGDPSGKSTERPFLSEEELNNNVRAIELFLKNILKHTGIAPIIVNNEDWLGKLSCIDFLRNVGKHFRLGVMLSKESVKTRLNSLEGMSFTEFSYQVLQAYDFYHLHKEKGVILQLGGSDQWGNIVAGIELIRKLDQKGAFGLTFPLLTRSDGKKFGKSEGGAVWLSSHRLAPYDFYQYLVGVPDADVIKLLKMLTFIELSEIEALAKSMSSPDYIANAVQKKLAEEVTIFVHGQEGLAQALRATQNLMPGVKLDLKAANIEDIARSVPNLELKSDEVIGRKFTEIALKSGLVSSKSEGVRLIQNGGAYLNEEKVADPNYIIEKKDCIDGRFILVAAGKKKKFLLRII